MSNFIEDIQLYLEDLCKINTDLMHTHAGQRAFSRVETDAHINEISQAATPNILVVADINGGRIGDFDDKKIRNYVTLIFASRAAGEDMQSAIAQAVKKSEEIMMDFMAKFDFDYEEGCPVLKDMEPEKAEWQKIEGPWLDFYYGWEFIMPFKSFTRPYNENKWTALPDAPIEGAHDQFNDALNFDSFYYNPITGGITFFGPYSTHQVQVSVQDPDNPEYGYVSAENIGFSGYAFPVNIGNIAGLTPGQAVLKWRKTMNTAPYTPVTNWKQQYFLVEHLAQRWVKLEYTVGDQRYPIPENFPPIMLYDAMGEETGLVNNIPELIDAWNADPANAHFPIINWKRTNPYYMLLIDPSPDQLLFPFQFIKASF